ncbi:MAG: aminoglycoside phosphotransferase [Micrococcales bacterium]|nr:MAG: aminoglycoside phosphotransferase [Micrococcales bacterium]
MATPALGRPSTVVCGEQSNTSIIVGAGAEDPLILKVFRTLDVGRNPDVEVVGALSQAGCDRVPALVGSLSGPLTGPGRDQGQETGTDLAVAGEYIGDSEDAWRVALKAASAGTDFTAEAAGLGAATAQVHAQLREVFGTWEFGRAARERLIEELAGRVRWALQRAGALDPLRPQLRAHEHSLAALRDVELPAMQRIHGDYHLGQVLHSPSRGWVLLDFEGEPLRPLAQRAAPDLAMRDLVSLIRSFDYAAGHVAHHDPGAAQQARHWVQAARDAFLAGYARATAAGPADPLEPTALYRALWVDKALYEVVYETNNRPDWVPIPLRAVQEAL